MKLSPRIHRIKIGLTAALIAAASFFISGCMNEAKEIPLLPDKIGEWKAEEPIDCYEGENLYLYINGGAEIYHEYGFVKTVTRNYSNSTGGTISAEIFEMESPASAFGIYTFKSSCGGREIPFGRDGRLEDYYLNFWKGRFLVTLTGYDEEETTVSGLEKIAGSIDENLENGGELPLLAALIPQENLIPGSLEYFRGYLGLFNSHRFFEDNILLFQEGVRGDYSDGLSLFIFSYPTPEAGQEAFLRVKQRFSENSGFSPFDITISDAAAARDAEGFAVTAAPAANYLLMTLDREKPDSGLALTRLIREKLMN